MDGIFELFERNDIDQRSTVIFNHFEYSKHFVELLYYRHVR